ncbi:tRNA (guanosine(37)-N1)-methyltransferase TrmD [Fodinicurvata sp. EGI_FJ10296]|uniref:tRNA (guanosine(37)-N1)-methyltransferase TrmD n=1 Tax=Fodinicurvata sp. EGI_FJ10296 TaxID=3231908 RepID=UPI0034556AE3
MTWRATVLSLFPDMFPGPLGESLAGRSLAGAGAENDAAWTLETVDIRDFAGDKHRRVDDTPFGGGAGMVLRADVLDRALRFVGTGTGAGGDSPGNVGRRLIYTSPRGRVFDQAFARQLADEPGVIILCGRYEGVDQRVLDAHGAEDVSIGDFILSGGELAALMMLDSVIRLLPGVMGNAASATEESFGESSGNGDAVLLEYPQFTRPAEWVGPDGDIWPVPEVLVSGDHGRVARWRRMEAERLTRERRPELWRRYRASVYGPSDVRRKRR